MLLDFLFNRVNTICINELRNGKKLAVFPLGKVGTFVKKQIEERFGQDLVCIDNSLCNFNKEIISVDKFVNMDSEDYTIILCAMDFELNKSLLFLLKAMGIRANIVNILEIPTELHEEKASFFEKIKEYLKVKSVSNFPLVRIGEPNDGGYVMLDDFDSVDAAYSFGISTNSMWDLEIAEKGIDVYCYDPYVSGLIGATERIHFFRLGLAASNKGNPKYYSLAEFLQRNNHKNCKNLLLKFDIEGAEWDVLDSIDVDLLACFRQISCELHNVVSMDRKEQILRCLGKLTTYHNVVWIHGNNAGRVEKAGTNVIPEYLEITFARKDLYKLNKCEYSCPIDIDAPNIKYGFDIELINWND